MSATAHRPRPEARPEAPPTHPHPPTHSGFSQSVLELKGSIDAAHPSLPPEASGSKWPKTSVACLREGRRLTPEQLAALLRACREESAASFGAARPALRIALDSAAMVLYACRCLERVVSAHSVPFAGGDDGGAAPAEAEQRRVAAILGEAEEEGYWFRASADGNREAHYRGGRQSRALTLTYVLLTRGALNTSSHPPQATTWG